MNIKPRNVESELVDHMSFKTVYRQNDSYYMNDPKFKLLGYCPYCKSDVMNCFNKAFCGKCGEKIKWPQKEN
jgi:hypothetical protein